MAGIGFELKKLFNKRGLTAIFKAYGYTGVITTGPMLLGVLLILGVMYIADVTGLSSHDRELLVCMITYALLASLTFTSFFSMVVTRHISDMLFEKREDAVMASFEGSLVLLLLLGGPVYGAFLCVSGIGVMLVLLNFALFCELTAVWLAMNYLTAVKDYKGILASFAAAVITAFLTGGVLSFLLGPSVEALMTGVYCGYGVMLVWDIRLLFQYFPRGTVSRFYFLRWFDEYRSLAFTGLFTNLGLFTHLVILWFSPVGIQVEGLFYGAPVHDVPALLAFLTILLTTINFVASVEVRFYPRYYTYYSLFNGKGSIKDIRQAEEEMLTVLEHELLYTARKQLYATGLVIAVSGLVLKALPLGFNDTMEGYFRILSVGYGIYAIGNTILLILLYFTDYKGAFIASAGFAAVTTLGTLVSLTFPIEYYGFMFAVGAAVFFLIAWFRLNWFTGKLPYHILSTQPIIVRARYGFFSRLGERLERGRTVEKKESPDGRKRAGKGKQE